MKKFLTSILLVALTAISSNAQLLWKISGNGFGGLIMSEAQSPAAQQLMMSAAMAPQDSTLTAVLTAAQTDSLNTMLQKYMGPMVSAAKSQPKPARPHETGNRLHCCGYGTSTVSFPRFQPAGTARQ